MKNEIISFNIVVKHCKRKSASQIVEREWGKNLLWFMAFLALSLQSLALKKYLIISTHSELRFSANNE